MIYRILTIRKLLYIAFACFYLAPSYVTPKANAAKIPDTIQPVDDVNNTKREAADCLKRALDFYLSIMTKRQYEDYGTWA